MLEGGKKEEKEAGLKREKSMKGWKRSSDGRPVSLVSARLGLRVFNRKQALQTKGLKKVGI